ncbi:MerR family transcriptional regulator [Alienimonas sp. DA493]|uniref:MerR family transcriptional regulator n=1 Tax=Alienimonas sp. DA493 TaxID=3373605 RepID=UPI00375468E1
MNDLMGLAEVSRLLGVRKHRISYALDNGLLPETARISNKRAFSPDDVRRLAEHFEVPPPDLRADNRSSGPAPAAVTSLQLKPDDRQE